ncbi:MAG: tetratricopeptide repeat protein [Bacteroidota bacterium]|nr:tetratricopeptide repeat protein [Bacteroidota bacterium]
MKFLKSYFILLITVISIKLGAQDRTVDSLKQVLTITKNDTVRLKSEAMLAELLQIYRISKWDSIVKDAIALNQIDIAADGYNNLGYLYQNSNSYIDAIKCYDLSIKLHTQQKNTKDACFSLYNKACCYKFFNKYNEAISYYQLAIKYSQTIAYREVESYCYNDLSIIYGFKGNIPLSINMIEKAIKIQESIKDYVGMGASYSTLASIYYYQNDLKKAEEIYHQCLIIYQREKYEKGISLIYANIGTINFQNGNFSLALDNLLKSTAIRNKQKDLMGVSDNFNTIGKIYFAIDSIKKGKIYYEKALAIKKKINDNKGLISTYNALANLELNNNNFMLAIDYATKANITSQQIGFASGIQQSNLNLYLINKKIGRHEKALKNYELYITMRDSLLNNETKKATIKSQLKYEYEKKAAADSVKVAEEKKLTTIKLKQEKTQRYFLYGGLGLTALFGMFMFNRFKVTQKQKNIINQQKNIVETQKNIVDEKQKEILDSIRYAKRIQQSLLPTEKFIGRVLNKKNN